MQMHIDHSIIRFSTSDVRAFTDKFSCNSTDVNMGLGERTTDEKKEGINIPSHPLVIYMCLFTFSGCYNISHLCITKEEKSDYLAYIR